MTLRLQKAESVVTNKAKILAEAGAMATERERHQGRARRLFEQGGKGMGELIDKFLKPAASARCLPDRAVINDGGEVSFDPAVYMPLVRRAVGAPMSVRHERMGTTYSRITGAV